MNLSIAKIKYPLLLIAILSFGCESNTKNQTDSSSDSYDSEAKFNSLSSVIDSVNNEIKDGDYGLIDHFMLIQKR